ncbi:UDP-N-acetylmuramoyl-L-alanyl-D-glutamate--2,6-diaminopimelate ligase [Breoghania sp. L-A4]|uniref:UDP-N-acetylmuramoyl-L-alanyl-D-glutamate--2, 6-diaminopimelate ligase n=1 Tax=Breoghania sp. L-A4 TaxID=2304600 RepID=UPI0013C308AD|nr:UDP-N-acetylmuramoyl-L-alanyl-D-glutamate--2,6-diaminopimelate ligase [Breoghania sp. L-A4]
MLLEDLAAELTLPERARGVQVSAVTADSRAVVEGTLFAALRGSVVDGARFVPTAVAQGAVAVLAANDAEIGETSVPVLRCADPRRALALMAARLAGRQPETIVAVTGTSGKTSVAVFTRQIFEAAGLHAASIGTVGIQTSSGGDYASLTTPDPVRLHASLAALADEGVTHAAMEASSHGLDQRRLDGVKLTAAAFTNLGRDHLDYHATVEEYLAAKLRLFDTLLPDGGTVVTDPGEAYADRVIAIAEDRGLPLLTVGEQGGDLRLVGLERDGFHQRLTIRAGGRDHTVMLPLPGRFQVSNALIAAGLAVAGGVAVPVALKALEGLKGASGRLEFAGKTAAGGLAFIDYAHKPEALDNALTALRPYASGRLILVFGAGGDRDPGKRPIMGRIAATRADVVIVTDDNPRGEDPQTIRSAILATAPDAIEIGDRGKAIETAIGMLGAGDVVCVAGKGHETGQILTDRTVPFSDHEAVRAALAALAVPGAAEETR